MIATAEKVYPTNISVDEAMKLVISAGIISPPIVEVGQKAPPAKCQLPEKPV
jgi:uncharacterized membrane protein